MRLALFGGSFDPPHSGHLRIARAAADRLSLDRVLLAPTGRQPLKPQGAAAFHDRLAMVKLLAQADGRLQASAVDAPQPDSPNYTVDTLGRLRPMLPLNTELFFLAGADSFLSLARWREPDALLEPGRLLDGWILAARPGFLLDSLGEALPHGYAFSQRSAEGDSVLTRAIVGSASASSAKSMPLHILPDLDDPATATGIRAALAVGKPTHTLPAPVAAYIRANGLYGPVLR